MKIRPNVALGPSRRLRCLRASSGGRSLGIGLASPDPTVGVDRAGSAGLFFLGYDDHFCPAEKPAPAGPRRLCRHGLWVRRCMFGDLRRRVAAGASSRRTMKLVAAGFVVNALEETGSLGSRIVVDSRHGDRGIRGADGYRTRAGSEMVTPTTTPAQPRAPRAGPGAVRGGCAWEKYGQKPFSCARETPRAADQAVGPPAQSRGRAAARAAAARRPSFRCASWRPRGLCPGGFRLSRRPPRYFPIVVLRRASARGARLRAHSLGEGPPGARAPSFAWRIGRLHGGAAAVGGFTAGGRCPWRAAAQKLLSVAFSASGTRSSLAGP